jgi:hypothetical protein
MKKMSLNKDGTPRRRRNSGKGGSAIVSLSVDEILDLVSQDVVSIPVSEDWVKGRLYANYLASKKVSQDFSDLQSVEDKIEFAITDFDDE